MKKKDWTPFQLNRLPESGYWLSFFDGGNGYTSWHLYCVMNGYVKYIREDDFNGQKSCNMQEWHTLQWNCMPTKKMIANPSPEETFYYFKTHAGVMEKFPDLPTTFHQKAPNDF